MTNNYYKNLRNITENQKNKIVKKVFSEVSNNYDLMNDIMSFGLHRIWKEQIFDFVLPKKKGIFLDLAGGSGDLSKIIKKKYPENECYLVDSNSEMIKQAKIKLKDFSVNYVCSSAEKLPFKNYNFNYILLAFGLRNFSNINKSLREIYRTLEKDGTFICLEFSQIKKKSLNDLVQVYYKLIPKIGDLIANNKHAYQYLIESIKIFPAQKELSAKLINVGFQHIECFDILGGIASIHVGKK